MAAGDPGPVVRPPSRTYRAVSDIQEVLMAAAPIPVQLSSFATMW
jgi:hypothetical protein